MKKLLLAMSLVLFLASCSDKIINDDERPKEIIEYVQTHFPNLEILQITKDYEGVNLTYEVIIQENYYIEFSRKFKVLEVSGTSKLPDSVIPEKILNYVIENYPDNYIISWELDDKNQQVELDNEMELKFNMKDEFLRID